MMMMMMIMMTVLLVEYRVDGVHLFLFHNIMEASRRHQSQQSLAV